MTKKNWASLTKKLEMRNKKNLELSINFRNKLIGKIVQQDEEIKNDGKIQEMV